MKETKGSGLKALEPCKECPFKRDSLQGYIGNHEDPKEITDIVWHDMKFPCHVDVTWRSGRDIPKSRRQSFEEAILSARHCVGALAMLNNACKRSRDPLISELQAKVGKREDCFNRPEEMVAYHRDSLLKRKR